MRGTLQEGVHNDTDIKILSFVEGVKQNKCYIGCTEFEVYFHDVILFELNGLVELLVSDFDGFRVCDLGYLCKVFWLGGFCHFHSFQAKILGFFVVEGLDQDIEVSLQFLKVLLLLLKVFSDETHLNVQKFLA
jgi:hypothetical protein